MLPLPPTPPPKLPPPLTSWQVEDRGHNTLKLVFSVTLDRRTAYRLIGELEKLAQSL